MYCVRINEKKKDFEIWFLIPISPQAVYLDTQQGGMTWDNLTYGEFPISYSLIMLAVDFFLYGILALYFDNVVPSMFELIQSYI